MRNAVQRRNHKERAQPIEREKWGLLEKAKDYKLRAANHREKKARLKLLKQKALEKNPDEFSFVRIHNFSTRPTSPFPGRRLLRYDDIDTTIVPSEWF